jgi:predicted  nucleic acid-binding Zn ribbon protein
MADDAADDPYAPLRPAAPAPEDELCSCPPDTPLKLMSMRQVRGFNPIHCLNCNLEVPPERLGLDADLVQAIADWDEEHGAVNTLELASGDYEEWAQARLLDPTSSTNSDGLDLVRQLNEIRRCYFWFFQPQEAEDWKPRSGCPLCEGALVHYDDGIFPQLLCERDNVVLPGALD